MSKNIHVVEDDESICEIVELILREEGFSVETSSTATEFSNTIFSSDDTPDLILLDIMLPDGDGRKLCEMVKQSTSTSQIPVILMSAHANSAEIISEGYADAFISKPFDIYYLVNEVRRNLGI